MISRRWRASIRGLSIWITSNRVTPWLVNNPPHVVPLPDNIWNLHNGGKLVHIPAAVKTHPVLPLTLQSNGKSVCVIQTVSVICLLVFLHHFYFSYFTLYIASLYHSYTLSTAPFLHRRPSLNLLLRPRLQSHPVTHIVTQRRSPTRLPSIRARAGCLSPRVATVVSLPSPYHH